VSGEVAYTVAYDLNPHFEGTWAPAAWKPSREIEHCVQCHGPDDMGQSGEGMNHQQGHMQCPMCRIDHTK
jgi:hypothetical protein